MLGTLKKVFGAGASEPCAGCDPAVLSKCSQAEAGSVNPHAYHVFVKLPPPAGTDPAAAGEAWWPERMEDE